MPLYLANRGQRLILGSVTSVTFPSSMVTRLIPRHSITCLDMRLAPDNVTSAGPIIVITNFYIEYQTNF